MKRVTFIILAISLTWLILYSTKAYSGTVTAIIIDENNTVWLGDDSEDYQLEWTSEEFDMPNLDSNESVRIRIKHYGVPNRTRRFSMD